MDPQDPIIAASDLTKRYGRNVGLEGVNLEVERGEVFGFLGPNGAGKTTMIRLLLDLIRPTRGELRLFGRSIGDPSLRARVGYLPGELSLDERLSGLRNLTFLDALRPRATGDGSWRRRGELSERLGLPASDLRRPVRDYSRGMKQKVGLIAALQHDPELLILDEPTTGLDPLVREDFLAILIDAGRAGKTVFHSSHVLSEVDRSCTRVGVVRDGRLLSVMDREEMRRASVRRMVVRFAGEAPLAELVLPGIELLEHSAGQVVLRVAGELDPLLRVLARHPVSDLEFPEPSLEEAFVELYRAGAGERA